MDGLELLLVLAVSNCIFIIADTPCRRFLLHGVEVV